MWSSPADLAAIPDFQSGAMENWGLTTYRETGLLYDPDRSSASDRMSIIKVIAHELAHQVAFGMFFSPVHPWHRRRFAFSFT